MPMTEFVVRITGGWEGSVFATCIEEARYNVIKMARMLNERVLFVGVPNE